MLKRILMSWYFQLSAFHVVKSHPEVE